MEKCPYSDDCVCVLSKCILEEHLSEDPVDSFFVFLEIITKEEKGGLYDQLFKDCFFLKGTVEEMLNKQVGPAEENSIIMKNFAYMTELPPIMQNIFSDMTI